MKERLVEIGVPADKILVQRNGIDGERFQERPRAPARQELGIDPKGYHVAYIGTFRVTKGLDVLLEAAGRLIAAGMPLTVHLVGDGPHLEAALREQARAGGIAARVRFHGYQPHDRVATWIAAADVLCLPSTSDGCPNIILETLACGRPVVATRVGGIPEILSEETGVLVPPADAAALAAGLQAALTQAWDPERLRASVIQRSWAKNGADLYQALLAAMPAAPAAPRQRAGQTRPQASP
jgi:glycosyltransferase involved in cell wall biosynthesis